MNGFRDSFTIRSIDDDVIDKIEAYIRTDLIEIVNRLKNQTDSTIYEEDFFGNVQLSSPSTFKFSIGERLQLKNIAAFINEIADDKNPKYKISIFIEKNNNQKKSNEYEETVFYPNFGRFYSNMTSKSALCDIRSDPKLDLEVLRSELYVEILQIFESIHDEDMKRINESIISVDTSEDHKLIGRAQCIFCLDGKNKKIQYSIPHKSIGNKVYWYCSNFCSHLKTHDVEFKPKKKKTKGEKSKSKPNMKHRDERKELLLNDNLQLNTASKIEKVQLVQSELHTDGNGEFSSYDEFSNERSKNEHSKSEQSATSFNDESQSVKLRNGNQNKTK